MLRLHELALLQAWLASWSAVWHGPSRADSNLRATPTPPPRSSNIIAQWCLLTDLSGCPQPPQPRKSPPPWPDTWGAASSGDLHGPQRPNNIDVVPAATMLYPDNIMAAMTTGDVDCFIGKRLRLRRAMMGLTQSALAKAIGISSQQLLKYEKGTNAISLCRLFTIAQLMHVSVSYFFEELEQLPGAGLACKNAHLNDTSRSSDRYALELIKAFMCIDDKIIRKRVAELVRAVAANKLFTD